MVSKLINQNSHKWKSEFVHEIFELESAQAILFIHLPTRARPDKLIWTLDPKGKFLVRSAYRVTTDQTPNGTEIHWSKLWNLRAPERVKMLLWRIGSNSLPTKDNLSRRIVSSDPIWVVQTRKWNKSTYILQMPSSTSNMVLKLLELQIRRASNHELRGHH